MKREARIRTLTLAVALALVGSGPLVAGEPGKHPDRQAQTGSGQVDRYGTQASTGQQQGASSQHAQGHGQSDETRQLESRIWDKFAMETNLNPYRVMVEVQGDRAVLRGEVDQVADKQLAERLAKEVPGINTVENRIEVTDRDIAQAEMQNRRDRGTATQDSLQRDRDVATTQDEGPNAVLIYEVTTAQPVRIEPAPSGEMSADADQPQRDDRDLGQVVGDATITAAVKSRLLWNQTTDGLQIDVDTRNGQVELSGSVDTEMARSTAERLARDTEGVRQVVNNLRINPDAADRTVASAEAQQPVNDAWITAKVKSSLLYSANVDGTELNVRTENGRVQLSGVASDQTELNRAVQIARDVRGVVEVDASDVRVVS